jgi:hypothetical protein
MKEAASVLILVRGTRVCLPVDLQRASCTYALQGRDAVTLALVPEGARRRRSAEKLPPLQRDEEEEERSVAAAALYAEMSSQPSEAVLVGPGMIAGPVRYLPFTKRTHLFWEYVGWCKSLEVEPASRNTFLSVFSACSPKLRIRKQGTHATCDTCIQLKKAIRLAGLANRKQKALEEYSRHIMQQWLDRQVYWHAMELSLSLRAALRNGSTFLRLSRSLSQMCLIVDGIDQAKFRIPRIILKGHSLDKLLRPALHVQGAWCHGFGYHLAVSDADMKKDTNNNIEVMARLLSQISSKHSGLPRSLHIQQDNTSRECKNQLILKFCLKLVALNIFASVTLSYLITGHTHENIDGTFGQITVKLSAEEFNSDDEVVQILSKLVSELGVDKDSREASLAYKLDEAADWISWFEETGVSVSQLTGPQAPHWFRVCCLSDVGAQEQEESAVAVTSPAGLPPAHPDDVVLIVKDRMASTTVRQVVRLMCRDDRDRLSQFQPRGLHERRPGHGDVKRKVASVAQELFDKGILAEAARAYLVGWAQGTRRRHPRPTSYSFLAHKVLAPHQASPAPRQQASARPVRVVVHGVHGQPLADGADDDETDAGPLIVAPM